MQRIMLGNTPNYVHTQIHNIFLSVTLRLMHLKYFLTNTHGKAVYKCWNLTTSWHPSMCEIRRGFVGLGVSEGGLVCKTTIPLIWCNGHLLLNKQHENRLPWSPSWISLILVIRNYYTSSILCLPLTKMCLICMIYK